ncbi:M20/M25/M40 family metallo-hydrolase [Pseudochelatococcus sp. B33]
MRELTLELVGWPSVTGTEGEAAFADRLKNLLLGLPAFSASPGNIRLVDSHGNPKARTVVALARGTGRRCLVLTGHFDVVSIDNFNELTGLAFDPLSLKTAMLKELAEAKRGGKEEQAYRDLLSDDFLPARGILDMKSGLAAGIAALEAFAADPERVGNVLFAAMPDEENRSRGARSFRDALPALAVEWDLDIVGAVNLDSNHGPGEEDGRSVFFGTTAKYSPFAFVVGQGTHVGSPFSGASAHLMAAEIIRAIETSADMADEKFGEKAAPPVCLEAKDLRHAYDVTTPDRVWLSFNWLCYARTAAQVLEEFRTKVAASAASALALQWDNRKRFLGAEGQAPTPRVMTVAELKTATLGSRPEAAAWFAEFEDSLALEENPLRMSRIAVDQLVRKADLDGPLVVIGFASLYYPVGHCGTVEEGTDGFRSRVEAACEAVERSHQTRIRRKEFFPGISDMSFFGRGAALGDSTLVADNTVASALSDRPPAGDLEFPVVNVGPWGRDAHQKYERLHTGYAFGVLPHLVCAIIREALA